MSIQDRVLAMLRAADTDDMDALLAAVARILATQIKPGSPPGAWTADSLTHLDEIALLFSLELFSIREMVR